MKIPHAVWRDGKLLRVRWGSKDKRNWDHKEYDGIIVYKDNQIILNPAIRRNKRLALATLIHEVTHDIDERITKMSEKARREKYHDSDSVAKWSMPHAAFNRFAYPFADFLLENGVELPCACEPCRKKKGAVAGP